MVRNSLLSSCVHGRDDGLFITASFLCLLRCHSKTHRARTPLSERFAPAAASKDEFGCGNANTAFR
jgi:hypothetical protein